MSPLNVAEIYRENSIKELEERIGVTFEKRENIVKALTRQQYINEHKNVESESNKRLALLGDAVLYLVTARQLYDKSDGNPDSITRKRIEKIKNTHLAEVARRIIEKKHILLGRSEHRNFEKPGNKLQSNVLEAVIGAIYLEENGLKKAEEFIRIQVLG